MYRAFKPRRAPIPVRCNAEPADTGTPHKFDSSRSKSRPAEPALTWQPCISTLP